MGGEMNRTQSIEAVNALFAIANTALATYAAASAKLTQAHGEGWTEHDERWGPAFAAVNQSIADAKARL